MLWRVALGLLLIISGMKIFSTVAGKYKYRPQESPVPEQAGVLSVVAIGCYFFYRGVNMKVRPNDSKKDL